MKLISWNMRHSDEAWNRLMASNADVALLQEATEPPSSLGTQMQLGPKEPWTTEGEGQKRKWRTAVVALNPAVQLDWFEPCRVGDATSNKLAVSVRGSLAAARVVKPEQAACVVVSMYGLWETTHPSTGGSWNYADAAVHRLISDLSALIGRQNRPRIIVAGDFNILLGYGDYGSSYWKGRYATVFDRMKALGLEFIGPQFPNGRLADPWPAELPADSRNVPTYHSTRQSPATATRQLDFVFASKALAPSLRVRALNQTGDWGPSDHCMIEVEV